MKIFKNPIFHILFYAAGFFLLIWSHKIAPSNLAGPGLDSWVLLLIVVAVIILFFTNLRGTNKIIYKRCIIVIHACGIGLLFYLLSLPT